jgi:hypothetical protein
MTDSKPPPTPFQEALELLEKLIASHKGIGYASTTQQRTLRAARSFLAEHRRR